MPAYIILKQRRMENSIYISTTTTTTTKDTTTELMEFAVGAALGLRIGDSHAGETGDDIPPTRFTL